MKNQFIRLTSGWIPVSVLLLFTIALIAGQARANLPSEIRSAPKLSTEITWKMTVPDSEELNKLQALPIAVDTNLAFPSDQESDFDIAPKAPGKSDDRGLRLNLGSGQKKRSSRLHE